MPKLFIFILLVTIAYRHFLQTSCIKYQYKNQYSGQHCGPWASGYYFVLFKFHSGACITNWFVSGEIDDTGDLSSRDGIAKDSNLFRDSNLEAEEYGSSQATSKPSAYTGMCTCIFQ